MKKIKDISKKDVLEYLKAIGCITIGTVAGIFSYWVCLELNLAIFGWNIGLIIAPLVAGYVETYFANRFLYETTGAVSAFILFLVTVIYGFILTNPTLGGNLITIGSIAIILQAAVPTLVNYFLIVLALSIISHTLGFYKSLKKFYHKIHEKLYYIFTGKTLEPKNNVELAPMIREKINTDDLGVLFLSPTELSGIEIVEYTGFYESVEFLKYDEKAMLKLENLEDKNKILIEDIRYIKDKALVKLADYVKNDGSNGVLGMNIQYDTIRKDKGGLIIQVSIVGTGIVIG